jgi:hypothetical protein
MAVLFTQHWDVAPHKTQQYTDFIMTSYVPAMQKLGLNVVGGYYVAVGMGPRIIAVMVADQLLNLEQALETEEYQRLTAQLMSYVTGYHSKIMVPTGRVKTESYKVHTGEWKFNQHWNIIPGCEAEYTKYIVEDYLPTMESLGIKVVAGWRVIVGSGPYIVSESSAPTIVHIAKAIDTAEYRRVIRHLKTGLITDYHSRILAPTGRIEIPFFLQEMMKGF